MTHLMLDPYDAGLLGGDDDSPTCWWHDYIRSELAAAHDFYEAHIEGVLKELAAHTVQGEPVSLRERLFRGWKGCSNHGCVVVEPRPGMVKTNSTCQCVVNASRSQLYMLQGSIQSVLSATTQAEQQPDVTLMAEALEFYANGDHLMFSDENAWDTVSGEPQNWLCDAAGTATVETGCFAKAALAAYRKQGGGAPIMTDLTVGKIYKVTHQRKGVFVGRITGFDDTWASVEITQGKAMALLECNEAHAGEEVTVRRCLCTFAEQEPSHDNQ